MESQFSIPEEAQQSFHCQADRQRQSAETQLLGTKNSGDRPDYIPYAKAMRLLAERIKATPEELAAWVFYGPELGGLGAYEHGYEFADPWPFSYAVRTNPIISEDYVSPLMSLWILKEEIINFYPPERYITGKMLIERWSTQPGIEPRAYILAQIWESRLMNGHPICGKTEADRFTRSVYPRLETGLFALSQIKAIEAYDFGNGEGNRTSDNKQPGHLNHDPGMQQRANKIAAELKNKNPKRLPTRDEV